MRPFSVPSAQLAFAEAYSLNGPSVSVVPKDMVTLLPNPMSGNHVPHRSCLSPCDFTPFHSDTYTIGCCKSKAKNRSCNARRKIERPSLSPSDLDEGSHSPSNAKILMSFVDVPSPSSSSDASKMKDSKDQRYVQRRLRNNLAAKRSRDNRKRREDVTALRANYLEKSNVILHAQILALKKEICFLRKIPFDPGYRPIVTEANVTNSSNPIQPFSFTNDVEISTIVSPVSSLNSTYIFRDQDHS